MTSHASPSDLPPISLSTSPCNQFGNQEPGSASDIEAFAAGYGVQFDVFAKVDVNGKNAHPVFKFVRSHLSDILGSSVKWNWTKFLCDRDGVPVKRFSPPTSPLSLKAEIEKLLDQQARPIDAAIARRDSQLAEEAERV